MCQVPSSLGGLLSLFAPAFTQPSFQTFSMLIVGAVARVRDCTITGMLQAAGLAGVWHHSRAHDFFARARWDPDELGMALLDFLVVAFLKAGAPLRLAVDDTLFGRSGRRVWGAHYLHDGAQPEGSGRRTRWGNCWVVVVLVVELPCLGGRPVGLPILFRLFRPKDDRHQDRPSQPELARTLIDMVLERFPARIVELIMDGAYATKAWRALPDRVTVTTRMRSNAAVFALAPPRTGKRGRPALKGARLASLAKLAELATFSAVTITAANGRSRVEHVATMTCLWYGPFHTRPVTVMLICKPDRNEGFDVALASTDLYASAGELIARCDSRWTIETAHQEAKAHGVGQARNRVQKAVERTVPFGFLTQTITIVWYALHGDPDADLQACRRAAPWYRHKTTVSYADARRPATRPDPPRILRTSTRGDQHTTNQAASVTRVPHDVGARGARDP